MNNTFEINKKYLIIVFVVIVLLTLITFWKSLDLYFWRDDWDLWWVQNYFWKVLKGHNHPGIWISRALLYPVLGWNSTAWQSLGLVLRIAASFSVFIFMCRISKSFKTGLFAALLFASSIIAMETVTWPSVYINALNIIFICFGFYFWIIYIEKRKIKHAIFSILLLTVVGIGDPGRVIFIAPMISLWEILNWWISKKREKFYVVIINATAITVLLTIFLRTSLFFLYKAPVSVVNNIKQIIDDPTSLQTLFASIGNLLLGWVQSPQGGELQYFSIPILIVLLLISLPLVLLFKSRFWAILLLFTLWIPWVYLPNWMFNKDLIVPPTDRYLSLSAVGYIGISALVISSIRLRFLSYLLPALLIFFNIKTAGEVLDKEAKYRSRKIVEPIWEKIDKDVPLEEKNSVFVYLGEDYTKYYILEWSGSAPFAIRRGIKRYEDYPIVTSDEKLILKLLCEDNVYRPAMLGWVYQKEKIPLSHLHAWSMNEGVLRNVSTTIREKYKKTAALNNCIL